MPLFPYPASNIAEGQIKSEMNNLNKCLAEETTVNPVKK
jgi:hypothetical protein